MSSSTAGPDTGSKTSFATDTTAATATADRGRQQHDQQQQQQPHRRDSRSPSQSRFKSKMSGIVEKVKAAVHGDSSSSGDESRGRQSGDYVIASGRGGAGNMFRSKSPANRHGGGVLSVEEERAQSKERARSKERPHASGRGGAGNIRSPSRDPAQRKADDEKVKALNAEEREAEAKHESEQKEHPDKFPVGRGGAGNIH